MAPVLRNTSQLAIDVRELLNMPEDDDLFVWPDSYFRALSKAHRYFRGKIAQHAPSLLMTTEVVASTDSGVSYDLGDHQYGDLEVWLPPGPPSGIRLMPALPESAYAGFYLDGTAIKLTLARAYSPGLYVRAVFVAVADLGDDQEHTLPAYCEDALIAKAAHFMALTPGFLGDPNVYRTMAVQEWIGDQEDPSDMGILGTIKRLSANEGIETAAGIEDRPWYKNIR